MRQKKFEYYAVQARVDLWMVGLIVNGRDVHLDSTHCLSSAKLVCQNDAVSNGAICGADDVDIQMLAS
jgi:hypothetical protein